MKRPIKCGDLVCLLSPIACIALPIKIFSSSRLEQENNTCDFGKKEVNKMFVFFYVVKTNSPVGVTVLPEFLAVSLRT